MPDVDLAIENDFDAPLKDNSGGDDKPLRPKVLLCGYYGFDNLGDELILSVLIKHLQERGAEVSVLSGNARATQLRHRVHAIDRMNMVDVVHALSQCHLFVSGGGGLFQDASGPLSTFYYTAMIGLARYFEVPVCFWGQGIGPLNLPVTEWLTKTALNWSDAVCVRDEASAQIAEHLLTKKEKLTLATDPVWLYDLPAPSPQARHGLSPEKNQMDKNWVIGISLRPSADLTPERLAAFADFLKSFVDGSPKPVQFLLLPFQEAEDTPVLKELERLLLERNAGAFTIVDSRLAVDHLQQCHILFGMRFHSIVLATLADVAVYGLIYDPKVRQLLKQLGLQGTDVAQLNTTSLNEENIRQYFQRYPAPDLETIQKQARLNLDVLDAALADCTAELEVLL